MNIGLKKEVTQSAWISYANSFDFLVRTDPELFHMDPNICTHGYFTLLVLYKMENYIELNV